MTKQIKDINIKGSKIIVNLTNGQQIIYPLSNYPGFTYNNYYFYYNSQKFSEKNKTLQDFEDFLDGKINVAQTSSFEKNSISNTIIISNWEKF